MKNLIKMGWVLASAVMLCFTSCLNEESDSNSGADQLPGNVATLSDQVAAMKSTVSEIVAVQASLAEAAELAGASAELEACAVAVNEHIAAVESGLSEVSASVAALKLQKQIAVATGSLKAQLALLGMDDSFERGVLSIEKGAAAWLGDDFKNYFEISAEQARLTYMVEVLDAQSLLAEAIASDVEAGLRVGDASGLDGILSELKACSDAFAKANASLASLSAELEREYAAAITSPTAQTKDALKAVNTKAAAAASGTTLTDLISRLAACEAALADIEARLEKVEADVAALLNMIQSLTFVSDYATENAYAYYNMDVNTKISDSTLPYYGKAKRTATGNMELTYMVRPASAAKALNANVNAVDVIGFYAKSIATRAPQASDYIDFDVTKVAVVNETRGLVTVTVKPNLKEAFYYKEIGAKCALNVKSGKTDIVSDFVEILPKDNSTTVYATSVTPSRTSIEFDKGESIELSAVVSPSNAVQVCYWTSSNNDIASFNGSTLNAVGVGETKVTVTTSAVDEWGLPLVAEIPVKVNEAIRLSGPPYVEVGYTADMFLDYPSNAIIETKVWSTSDASKLTVDQSGKVTGVAHTYNTETKSYGEVTVSCTINGVTVVSWPMKVAAVQPKAIVTPALSNGQTEISMRVDESLSLASTISPTNVPEGAYKIRYQSDHDRFINFDTGVINEYKNTLSPTNAYVYITVDNNDQSKYMVVGSLKKTVIVKVLPYYVKTITLNDVEMQLGQTVTLAPQFTADVSGKTPTNTKVTWKSSNTTVATVDDNGVVTSKTSGTVTITATATDGSGVSGSCRITITQPWKSFELGDYVVRTSSGDIEFASEINAAKSKGTVVGVVVAKTNPRATDSMLPSSCTHGVAVALGEGEGKWWSGAPSSSPYKVYEWATQNGYQSTMGVDWNSSNGTHRAGTAELFVGYNNTLALKAFISARGLTSEMISALNAYNGPTLPNGASSYYLPSVAEMDAIAAVSNNSWALSSKLETAGGTKFSNAAYWTVSDSGNSSSNAAKINPLTGALDGAGMKTNAAKFRYVFAF